MKLERLAPQAIETERHDNWYADPQVSGRAMVAALSAKVRSRLWTKIAISRLQ